MHQGTANKTHKMMTLLLALIMICAPILSMPVETIAAVATSYFVDGTNGDDSNNGLSTSSAFKTIQKAANVAVSGDNVEIMAGTYRETVTPKSDGVAFQNYNGDKVTLSGGDLVTGWTPTADAGIYSAPMSWDYQNGYGNIVYYTDAAGNDTSLSQARWPNIPDSMMFNKAKYAKYSSTGAIAGTISNGGANLQMSNIALNAANPLPNSTTNAWKDALIVSSVSNGFTVYTGKVTGSSTTLSFEWPYTTGYLPQSGSPGFGFYLTNSYQALRYDVANPITGVAGVPGVAAWYKDVANQQLFVAVPGGEDPNNGTIEAKKREFAFDLAGRTGITISGINVRAAGVNFANSSNNMFKGATIEMVDSFNKPFAVDTPLSGFVSGFILDGDHNTIRDCEVKNMFGFGIVVKGHDNNVINNHVHDFNRYGLYADGINVNGYNHLISHNSIHAGGRAALGGTFTSSVIAYNDIYDVMKISYDGGIFYVVNSDFGSSEIHHNTVHDSPGDGIYFDNLSFDAVVYNNIIWNVTVGMLINTPNERMIMLNNTVYNTSSQSFGTWGDDVADGIGSYGSVLMGNILENTGFESQAAGGAIEQSNTLDTRTNIQSMFVDPANKNFALKNPESQRSVVIPGVTDGFTSAAPVKGAVQPGMPWKSGHDFDNAANINPTFKLNNIPYKQLLKNAGFPTGDLNGWTTTNTPEIVVHNGWDFRASGLVRDGAYGVALNEGDGIAQTVTGLKPNTTYNLSVWGKVLGKQVPATTMTAGSDPVTPVNYRAMNGYMIPGTKTTLKFTGIDFGAGMYDKVNFATVAASGTGKIEMYIGDPANGGTLVATDPFSDDVAGQKGQWYYRNAIALTAVTGVKDVYLVFTNTNTTVPLNCYFADFTLFDSTVDPATDYIELGASGLAGGTVTSKITSTTFTKGTASRPSIVSFTTGPSDTSVTIYAKKAGGGGLTGYLDEFGLAEEMAYSGLKGTTSGSTVNLRWQNVPGAVSFDVLRSTVAGGPYTTAVCSAVTNFACTDATTMQGLTYYYVLKSRDLNGAVISTSDEFAISLAYVTSGDPTQSMYSFDSFETGLNNWAVALGTPTLSSAKSHSGSRSYITNEDKDAIQQIFSSPQNKVVSLWFYDDASKTCASPAPGCMQNAVMVDDGTNIRSIGVNTATAGATNKYVYRVGGTLTASTVTRTTGWHQFVFDYTSGTKVDMYIDGTIVASPTGLTSFKRIILGDQWAANLVTTYYDDVRIDTTLPVYSINVIGENTITTLNGTLQLQASVLPAVASNSLTWSVYDADGVTETDKATIDSNGLLTAKKDGTVIVVATANDNSGVKVSKTITISGQIPVASISVNGADGVNAIAVEYGTLQMQATVMPTNAANKSVTWSVFEADGVTTTDKASINVNGVLTAVTEGNVQVVATAVDGSGVQGSSSVIIDYTPAVTTDNAPAGWVNSDTTVTLNAIDNVSGVAATYFTVDGGAEQSGNAISFNTDGVHTLVYWSVDHAGNVEQAHTVTVSIDKTAPTITVSGSNSTTVYLGSTYTDAAATATDNVDGDVTSTIVTTGTVDTSKEGTYTITYSVQDRVGNTAITTRTVQVINVYKFSGILNPINSDGSSVFKKGSTVPVKFQLTDALNQYVSNLNASIKVTFLSANVDGTDIEDVISTDASTGTLFRYDSTAKQYIFNLSTKNLAAGKYQVEVVLPSTYTLVSTTPLKITFSLRSK